MSARHHADVILCRRQPGTTLAKLCSNCEGRCVLCDSYIRPAVPVKLCIQCASSSQVISNAPSALASSTSGSSNISTNLIGAVTVWRCVICDAPSATHTAYYCRECAVLEKDRDGCPKATNMASARLDMWYERKKRREPFKLVSEVEKDQ